MKNTEAHSIVYSTQDQLSSSGPGPGRVTCLYTGDLPQTSADHAEEPSWCHDLDLQHTILHYCIRLDFKTRLQVDKNKHEFHQSYQAAKLPMMSRHLLKWPGYFFSLTDLQTKARESWQNWAEVKGTCKRLDLREIYCFYTFWLVITGHVTWSLPGFWLVNTYHVTWILVSDWTKYHWPSHPPRRDRAVSGCLSWTWPGIITGYLN